MSANYRKEAEEAFAHCVETNQQGKDPVGYAQAAATLYLAEQQHIANLIEVGRDRVRQLDHALNDPNFRVIDDSTAAAAVPTALLYASNTIKAQIREGLGIS